MPKKKMGKNLKNKKNTKKGGKRRKRNKFQKLLEMLVMVLVAISSIVSMLGIIMVMAKEPQPEPQPQQIIVEIENVEIYMETEKAIDKPIIPKEVKPIVSYEGPSGDYYYKITEAEKEMLAKLVYQEARGEALEGKVAVAATVFNRFHYTGVEYRFDNESIESIIKESGQYASIKDVTHEMLDTVPECREAVELACRGWDPTRRIFPEGAKFFYAPNPDLISEEELKKREGVESLIMDNHVFHDELNSF